MDKLLVKLHSMVNPYQKPHKYPNLCDALGPVEIP
jgi:hypothetical protein